MSHLLEVRDLTGGYGLVQVLRGIDFYVDEGELIVILGANGAGKTTTLRALSGMIGAKGRMEFAGRSILGRRTEEIVRLGLAHVPQGRGTVADLTVEENLRVGAYVRRDREVGADLERWYGVFPRLKERCDQAAGNLSGGEQQMLAIARALMSRPRLLLLDEPSLGLAPILTRDLFDRLGRISRELAMTVVVVEQNANLALEIADRGYVLEAGRIATSGTASELAVDESVRKSYLGY
ncbi:MAG: ABC transporter ATP-binding protein [Acidimicrobiales bacterium]